MAASTRAGLGGMLRQPSQAGQPKWLDSCVAFVPLDDGLSITIVE
ncbi:MAG: hypothetical protein ACRDQU_22765 [Pseudonocardiaceae bacterium]